MNAAGRSGAIVGVVGGGLVGAEVVRVLSRYGVRTVVADPNPAAAYARVRRYGAVMATQLDEVLVADVVALCGPAEHADVAAKVLAAARPVVSVSDDLDDVRALVGLTSAAETAEVPLIVGTAMAPGLTGLLARWLTDQLAVVDELHVAVHGTGGPACATQHHRALGATALGWHDGEWIERPGGSGRELCWFPEPIGPHDCYRAQLVDPLLLHHIFPDVMRISARVSGTRRDRLTARLPMLTPPHQKGNEGSVRVEARGADAQGRRVTKIVGSAGRAAQLAGAVCGSAIVSLLDGRFLPGVHLLGGDRRVSADLLDRLYTLGVGLQEYTGDSRPAAEA